MRPSVSVVMPFAGDLEAARAALESLAALRVQDGDQLILADNAGVAGVLLAGTDSPGVEVVFAPGERSPSHARNAGGRHARGEWILFIDADCIAPPDLLERYFLEPVADDVGALVGEIVPARAVRPTLAERYGNSRSFLSQQAHLAHRYLPRAAAANLMVRRVAFGQLGGFYEGLRAAEDTDFSWRLQQAGWRLELRVEAHVEHRYRASLGELRRQWRGYAAGRSWLARRYSGFRPEPAAARAARRLRRAGGGNVGTARTLPRRDRAAFFALDALLAGEELAGLALSNRPGAAKRRSPVNVVLVAERFPAPDDPLVEFATTLDRARVEAAARPARIDAAAGELRIDYREDDGPLARALALASLAARHPVRCLLDRVRRPSTAPSLTALAPAVRRLQHDGAGVRVHALGSDSARATAARLAALTEARHEHHLLR
ncbi:MAG: glycosyltransferase family 2 protein [Solirubrobacteraceae bacterium]